MRFLALRAFLKTKKGRYILLASFVLVVIIGFGVHRSLSYKSPEYIKNETQIKQAIATGWQLKYAASVKSNKDRVLEIRKLMPDFYSNNKGELTKQQRLITTALDNTIEEGSTSPIYERYNKDENQAIVGFQVNGYNFDYIRIEEDRATVKADIEYRIERLMLAQRYPTIASNTYQWELIKSKNKWLIEKEDLIQEDGVK